VLLASQYGIRNANGHELSLFNQCLLIHQFTGVSIVGGFQQWREQGRRVMKGARALAIWIPLHKGDASAEPEPSDESDATGSDGESAGRSRFIVGNVFDISQTESAADAERTAKTHEAEHVTAAPALPPAPVLALPAPATETPAAQPAPVLTIWDVETPAHGQQLLICPPPAPKKPATPPPPPLGDEFELCAA
jgi:hypothetical protein